MTQLLCAFIMGPKRVAPYNPELPINWTAARLKSTLNDRGIPFPANARRSALLRLLTSAPEQTHNATAQSHSNRSQQATQNENNNSSCKEERKL